jgi:NAD(P)-dependent dehydrogenase (short-subunit alcohol dehydrogenase family)
VPTPLTPIISGNAHYGVGEALAKVFPQAVFASRSTGFDFDRPEDRARFAEISLGHSVYISCSALHQFRQTLLLQKVFDTWLSAQHQGHLVVLGSSADSVVKGTPWVYPAEKKALRAFCRNLSLMSLGGHGHKPSGIRITYLSPGYLNTPNANAKHPNIQKIDCSYIASLVQWVLLQPEHVNVSELCLDPIQEIP